MGAEVGTKEESDEGIERSNVIGGGLAGGGVRETEGGGSG